MYKKLGCEFFYMIWKQEKKLIQTLGISFHNILRDIRITYPHSRF